MIYILNEDYAPLYHGTFNLFKVINSNKLLARSDDNQLNKNFIYFTRSIRFAQDFVSDYEWNMSDNAVLKLDKNKLKNKYRIQPFRNNDIEYEGNYSEYSEVCDSDIDNLYKYIIEIEVPYIVSHNFTSGRKAEVFHDIMKLLDDNSIENISNLIGKTFDKNTLIKCVETCNNDKVIQSIGSVGTILNLINVCLENNLNMSKSLVSCYNIIK